MKFATVLFDKKLVNSVINAVGNLLSCGMKSQVRMFVACPWAKHFILE